MQEKPKHILYIIQFFGNPEESWAANRSWEFAKKWAIHGSKVTVVTGWSHLLTDCPNDEILPNVTVKRIGNPYSSALSPYRRVLNFLQFAWQLLLYYPTIKQKPDVIYASSTPLTIPFMGLIAKKLFQARLVSELRDIWPDFPIEIIPIKSSLPISLLRFFEKMIYNYSDRVVVMNKRAAATVATRIDDSDKISISENGCSSDYIDRYRSIYNRDKIILYAGSLGMANDVEWLTGLFNHILNEPSLSSYSLYIYGTGNNEALLNRNISKSAEGRCYLNRPISRRNLFEIYCRSTVSIVSFRNLPSLEYNSPNKWYDSLSTGTPVITNFSSDISEETQNFGIGICSRSFDEITDYITSLSDRDNFKTVSDRCYEVAKTMNRERLSLEIFNRTLSLK